MEIVDTVANDAISKYVDMEKFATFEIPVTQSILELESTLYGQERERFWMFLKGVILNHKSGCHRVKSKKKDSLPYNQLHISSDLLTAYLGSFAKNTYEESKTCFGMKLKKNEKVIVKEGLVNRIVKAGIITLIKKGSNNIKNPDKSFSSIYEITKSVMDTTETKTVTLISEPSKKAMAKAIATRIKPFQSIDRKILCGSHQYLDFTIGSEEFKAAHTQDAINRALSQGKTITSDWYDNFNILCQKIDKINLSDNDVKFTNCSVDCFGRRLHHTLTYIPTSARQYARIRGKGTYLYPLFELDLKTAQVFFLCLCAIKDGVTDNALITDLNTDLYEAYKTKRGLATRGIAKQKVFQAIFDVADNFEIQKMEEFYPEFVAWLNFSKSVSNEKFKAELEKLNYSGYVPHKNTAIKAQRCETVWARKVWTALTQARIRFIPIHDSVLIFGSKQQTRQTLTDLEGEVTTIMHQAMRKINEEAYGLVKPEFKCVPYLTVKEDFEDKAAELASQGLI